MFSILMIIIFLFTVLLMMWRPNGLNETIPTTISAVLVLVIGIVPYSDVLVIFEIVSGASFTILSTIIMSIVLDSIGFFRWIAYNLVKASKGSGVRLYININLLCFLMTLFFNNDGSILITTPIIIHIVTILNLKPHQQFPYLISGALIATAASAPIAVSNIANLIALKIVGLTLNSYVHMMFVPSMIAILTISLLLYAYFKNDIPKRVYPITSQTGAIFLDGINRYHPLKQVNNDTQIDWWLFKVCIVIVILVRAAFFALSPFGVPIEWIGIIGAALLVGLRYKRKGTGVKDVLTKTPWHILLFAFSMYVLVYGLRNIGLNDFIIDHLREYVIENKLNASIIMGVLLTILSNIFNNLPAVMIGTLSLMEMGLDLPTLQISYLAVVIGSDIGALLTPVGTLATLIWMYILRKHSIHITWAQYIKVTIMVVPIGLIVGLLSLYFWVEWLFF